MLRGEEAHERAEGELGRGEGELEREVLREGDEEGEGPNGEELAKKTIELGARDR